MTLILSTHVRVTQAPRPSRIVGYVQSYLGSVLVLSAFLTGALAVCALLSLAHGL